MYLFYTMRVLVVVGGGGGEVRAIEWPSLRFKFKKSSLLLPSSRS